MQAWPSRIVLLSCLGLGAFLRCVWLSDTPFLADQIYIFDACKSAAQGGELPALGMPSGVRFKNPGMSLWVHMSLCRIFGVETPLGLARLTPLLAVLALFLLWAFVEKEVPRDERPAWRAAIALSSASTLAIAWHRLIWSQTLLPVFCVLYLWSWWRRDTRAGAFSWGLLSAMLGQIHMSGFFFAFVFCVGELAWRGEKRARLPAAIAGLVLGALPLLPWVRYLAEAAAQPGAGGGAFFGLREVANVRFLAYWLAEPLGLELGYALGDGGAVRFLAEPTWLGHRTYLVGLAHSAIFALSGVFGWAVLRKLARGERPPWRGSESWRAIAYAIAFGLLMTVATLRIHRHYLMVAFPLPTVFFCALALWSERRSPRLLGLLCALQFFVSASFLRFVHDHPPWLTTPG